MITAMMVTVRCTHTEISTSNFLENNNSELRVIWIYYDNVQDTGMRKIQGLYTTWLGSPSFNYLHYTLIDYRILQNITNYSRDISRLETVHGLPCMEGCTCLY